MRTKNLAVVFVDLVGFTQRTSSQTRQESALWLEKFYNLIKPLAFKFHGRVVKTIGDAVLLVFDSPTDGLLFSMAAQDSVFDHNRNCSQEHRMEIRVAANVGEVRLSRGDVYGEAVNIAARIEEVTPAGEIWFSEAVYLAMNKSEVPAERVGERQFKGVPEPVTLYRVPQATTYRLQAAGEISGQERQYPYGGMALQLASRRNPSLVLSSAFWLIGEKASQLGGTFRVLLREKTARYVLLAFLVTLVILLFVWWLWPADKFRQIRLELENGNAKQALAFLQVHPDRHLPEGLALEARARLGLPRSETQEAWELLRQAIEKKPRLLSDRRVRWDVVLCLDSEDAQPVMEWLTKERAEKLLDELYAASRDRRYFLRWNSIRLLEKLGKTDIDYVQAYIYDLDYAGSCSTRKRAAQKLGELKDRRAVDALRRAQARSFLENLCMGDTLEKALKSIGEK